MLIVRSTPAYVVAYLVLMVPTYILPYAGSNSALVNGFSTAMGMGPTPQWWAHAWCLVMLVVLGWLRGNTIGKAFLPALPAVAALFDMTPGLSMVPLIPTLLHLAAIFFGAQVTATADQVIAQSNSVAGIAQVRNAKIVVGLTTLLAIGGSILFVSTLGRSASPQRQMNKAPLTSVPASATANATRVAVPVTKEKTAQEPGRAPAVETPPKPQTTRIAKPDRPQRKPPARAEQPEVRYIRLND